MNPGVRKLQPVTRIFLATMFGWLLSAADAPWHESIIQLPGNANKLTLGVRQIHPFLAEYEYRVSGKLPNGKSFTQKLSTQCGGQALLTIDQIPGRGDSAGYLRFHLIEAQEGISADFLDLDTGLLSERAINASRSKPVGYIGCDLKFYKASASAFEHSETELALQNKEFTKALQIAKKELTDARSSNDKGAIASALYDVALSQQLGNLASPEKIEQAYSEAVQLASELPSDPRVTTKSEVLSAFAMFYEKRGNLDKAEQCLKQCLTIAEKSANKRNKTIIQNLNFSVARLELMQGRKDEAINLIRSTNAQRGRTAQDEETSWQELYPFIALLEHDIEAHFKTDTVGNSCHVHATFEVPPTGIISKVKIISMSGAHCDFPAYMAIMGSGSPVRTPFPTDKTVHCDISMTSSRDGSSVIISGHRPESVASPTRAAAQEVNLQELLQHASKYNGKYVVVSGFYRWVFSRSLLGLDKDAVEKQDYKRAIRVSEPLASAHGNTGSDMTGAWVTIEGTLSVEKLGRSQSIMMYPRAIEVKDRPAAERTPSIRSHQ